MVVMAHREPLPTFLISPCWEELDLMGVEGEEFRAVPTPRYTVLDLSTAL